MLDSYKSRTDREIFFDVRKLSIFHNQPRLLIICTETLTAVVVSVVAIVKVVTTFSMYALHLSYVKNGNLGHAHK